MKFSAFMDTLKPGVLEQLEIRRQQLVSEGREVINLSIGTPNLPPPVNVMEAVREAAMNPDNYKYAVVDSAELQEAVINWYKARYNVTLARDEIMSVYGSQEGIAHISFVLCNPGDTVIVGTPGYPIFAFGPLLRGAMLHRVLLKEENGFLIDFDSIDEQAAKKAKMMIVSYPNNPLAAVANDDFYERLIAFAKKYDIIVVHDNAYSEFVHKGPQGGSFLQYKGAKDIGIEFNSLSKIYNLTGLRISFALGSKDIVKAFRALRSNIDYGISLIDQKAAVAALTGPQDVILKNRAHYKEAGITLCNALNRIGWKVPESKATMFAWLPVPCGRSSEEFALEMVEKAGVICVPGSAFGEGGEGYVRIALVVDAKTIEKAAANIAASGII